MQKIGLVFFALCILFSTTAQAKYMYCEGETDGGVSAEGECYIYSHPYGDLESFETDDGEEVTGECYVYGNYAELDGAETESGEEVTGDCYWQ